MKRIMADQLNNNFFKIIDMTEKNNCESYCSPEIDMILIMTEGVLANSLGEGEAGGGTDGEGWG